MRLLFFIAIICVFLGNYSNAQDLSKKMEQENLDFLLHNILFDELTKSRDDTLYIALFNKFLSVELIVDTLKSENFNSDFFFLSISTEPISSQREVLLINKNKFILGVYAPSPMESHYSKLTVFRLSGFSVSDFPYFRVAMKIANRDEPNLERMALRKCQVEGLNFKLLAKSFRKFDLEKRAIKYPKFTSDPNLKKVIVVE